MNLSKWKEVFFLICVSAIVFIGFQSVSAAYCSGTDSTHDVLGDDGYCKCGHGDISGFELDHLADSPLCEGGSSQFLLFVYDTAWLSGVDVNDNGNCAADNWLTTGLGSGWRADYISIGYGRNHIFLSLCVGSNCGSWAYATIYRVTGSHSTSKGRGYVRTVDSGINNGGLSSATWSTDSACCSVSDCVYNGQCYSQGSTITYNGHKYVCWGRWYDPDTDSNSCSQAGGTWYNLGSYTNSYYPCCGDDGSSDNFATYSGSLTTSTTVSCRRCQGGVDKGTVTLHGNGYHTGDPSTSTEAQCYPGDITCTASSASSAGEVLVLGNGILFGTGTSRTCYYGDWSCGDGTYSNGESGTIFGWGYYTGSLTSSTSTTCYYGAGKCSDGSASNGDSAVIYGNGYLSGSGTSRTCYYGDMSCSSGSYSSGAHTTIYGWGYPMSMSATGNHGTGSEVDCYYGAGSCGDGTHSNGADKVVYGGGWSSADLSQYPTTTTCYYGSYTCKSGSASSGSSVVIHGNGYLSGSGTSRTCYYGQMSCTSSGGSNGAAATIHGWGYHTGSTTSSTSLTCYYGAGSCGRNSHSDGAHTTLVGNGYLSGSGTSRTCYYGDITCGYNSHKNGDAATVLGWGYYTGSLTTSTSSTCYYGAGSCTNGGHSNGATATIYGNGYHTGDPTTSTTGTCYYGDMSCSSGSYSSGTHTTVYGNGYLSGSGTSRTCYYGDWSCGDGTYSYGAHTTIHGWGYSTGDPTTATSLTCYYGAGSCTNGGYSNGTSTTLFGNGYRSGTTCYYGDITCGDNSYGNGAKATLKCSSGSYCLNNNYCYYDVSCGNGNYNAGTQGDYCPSTKYTGGVCYSERSCSSAGSCSYSSLNHPPTAPSSVSLSPSCTTSGTTITASGKVSDQDSDNVKLQVCKDSSCSTVLCTSGSVSSGSTTSCQFPASSVASSTGSYTVYFRTIEAQADACGKTKVSGTVSSSFNYDVSGPNAPTNLHPTSGSYLSDATPTFSWSAPSDNGCNGNIGGYEIDIYSGSSCSGSAVQTGSPTSTSWTASTLSQGTYSWRVRAKDGFGNYGSYSSCNSFMIDTTPPSCSVSGISESSSYAYVSGKTIWYNTVSSGGFNVYVSASDSGSGVSTVHFPDTVSLGGFDSSSPYSHSYGWTTSSSYSSSATVLCYDKAYNMGFDHFSVIKDTTAPSGGYVKYPNTVYTINHITIGLNTGSDNSGGSGIASGELQEAIATLSDTTCGTFGSWQNVTSTLDSTYTVNIANNTCYMFRYVVKDRVNNEVIYSSANIVKVKLNAPYYCGYLVAKPWLNLNSSSGTVGIVDYQGNFLIKATVTHTNTVPPNSYSNSLAILEQSQPYFLFNLNDAYIKGDFVDAASVPAADGGDLIINYSQPVANFNSNGNIYLKGYALYIGATTPCGSGFVCDNTYNCVLQ